MPPPPPAVVVAVAAVAEAALPQLPVQAVEAGLRHLALPAVLAAEAALVVSLAPDWES